MQQRDPNRLWYWLVIATCICGVLPVFFLGTAEPLIMGIPLWVLVSLISTAVLTVVTIVQLRFGWSIAQSQPDEQQDDD